MLKYKQEEFQKDQSFSHLKNLSMLKLLRLRM